MIRCDVLLEPAFTIAPVPRRLFGSFVEHMGRCVYGGLFEPDHPSADEHGLRRDVIELTRELGVSLVRYPGGNFVSGYDWRDGVGPVADRPSRLDLAWRSIETNTFGLDEFMTWAGEVGCEPMMAVNLGTKGIAEACELLEYANYPGGTALSDLRRKHGAADPYGIKLWCLGNEMDGPWQTGHKSADDYGKLAAETAKAMKQVDPSIELVACGSSNDRMPTFGAWEATVLDHTFEHVDYLSLHAYFEQVDDDQPGFLASAVAMDRFIEGLVATCDHVAAKKRSRRKLKLSFDEWNIWYESRFVKHTQLDWAIAPRLIEDTYTAIDAVVVGNLLMSLLRHSDRIDIACQAQLVNVIAPIRTQPDAAAWRQTIFHPFALTARYARGEVLRVEPRTPTVDGGARGDVDAVDVLATYDQETGDIAVFAVNRDPGQDARVEVRMPSLPGYLVADHLVMGGPDLLSANTSEDPNRVRPVVATDRVSIDATVVTAVLAPISWNLIRLSRAD